MKLKSFIIVLLFFFVSVIKAQNKTVELNSSWQFKQTDQAEWHTAKVPGNVFIDLLNASLIKDPYHGEQVNESRWVEKKDWEYKTNFDCESSLLKNQHVELIFEGLDTHASVFLNDSLILKANNMFRTWTVDVKKYIHAGSNRLHVIFHSAVNYGLTESSKLPYTLPEGERIFSRKAQFQFGWDFAPRFVGCGIWKSVKISTWNDLKINSVRQQILSVNDSIAKLNFIVESSCDSPGDYDFSIQDLTENSYKLPLQNFSQARKLHKGINNDTLKYTIYKPKLWWCNGFGEAFLYNFYLEIGSGSKVLQSSSLSVGLRKIELVKEIDADGVSFYFRLNNVPVFMKGANYVPNDVFLRSKTSEEINEDFDRIKNSHMNMLRVWGGGIYQDDEFYNVCDRNGILVWQDFMFACAMYPGDTAFILNTKQEIKEQIIRLRNHPSLALWCGNNEIEEAWNNWGWQKQFKYSKKDSTKIRQDYENLFHEIIGESLQKYDPDAAYWASSPLIGWGHKESLELGDSHYWGVWWGMEPFEMYKKKSGRFMSEYGFQSLPALSTFRKVCPDTQLNLNSSCVKIHQKHIKGYETIQTYMERAYKIPQAFDKYIYVSQLLQRDGMQMAIETHRSNKPVCMGTLFWQYNDCWPLSSWSAIDFYKQPKALNYALRNLYRPQMIGVQNKDSVYQISVVSDSLKNIGAKLNVKLLDKNSKILWEKNYPAMLRNVKVFKLKVPKKDLPAHDSTSSYLKFELESITKDLATSYYFFTLPKNSHFPKAKIDFKKIDETTIELSSDVFAKDVYLCDESGTIVFSDNFFNLEAGTKKTLKMNSSAKIIDISTLKIFSLNNL